MFGQKFFIKSKLKIIDRTLDMNSFTSGGTFTNFTRLSKPNLYSYI